jgi:hypothetical protein
MALPKGESSAIVSVMSSRPFDDPVFKARRLRFGALSRLRGITAWKIRNKAAMDARDILEKAYRGRRTNRVKKISFIALCACVGGLVSTAAWAHHGDAGRYNEEVIDITGTVLETQLVNPHAILVVEVTDAAGKKVRWQAELNAPMQLIKQGWVNDVKPGTKVTLSGRRLKSGAPYMNLTERARVLLTDSGKVVLQNANYGQAPSQ